MADWSSILNTFLFNDLNIRELGSKNYKSILSNIDRFRRSDGSTDDRNLWTDPTSYYFKPFFYFDSAAGNAPASRLLGLDYDRATWASAVLGMGDMKIGFGDGEMHPGATMADSNENNVSNSAMNFLLQNCEWERAEKLLQFIRLLSDISTYEPWQFQQVSGINDALTRKIFSGEQQNGDEQRKAITFKCLQSGYNDRIGTLMDLYRDVCFSYTLKKEIVPANLRKFDMGIYIISAPVRRFSLKYPFGVQSSLNLSTIYKDFSMPNKIYEANKGEDDGKYHVSVKYLEFLNCEFDYNSNAGAYSEMSNAEGKLLENEIKIFYDDCYEMRYNEFMMRVIGDSIFQDTDFETKENYYQVDRTYTENDPSKKWGILRSSVSPSSALKSVSLAVKNDIKNAVSDDEPAAQKPGPLSNLTGRAAQILEGNVPNIPLGSLRSNNAETDEPAGVEADTTTRVIKRGFVKKLQ